MIKNDVYDTAKNDIYYGLSITILLSPEFSH